MKQFYSNHIYSTGRGYIYMVELEPGDKVSVGEEVLIDGEKKVVWGLDSANWKRLRDGNREVGIIARDAVARTA